MDLRLSVYGVVKGEKMDKLEYALYRAKVIGKTDCSKWYEGFYSMQTDRTLFSFNSKKRG